MHPWIDTLSQMQKKLKEYFLNVFVNAIPKLPYEFFELLFLIISFSYVPTIYEDNGITIIKRIVKRKISTILYISDIS